MTKRTATKALLAASIAVLAATAMPAGVAAKPTTAAYTHQSAPTQFIEVNGNRLAYRRFGQKHGLPLVFFQHFVGNIDNWDPAITDGLARSREVILFDNAGVARSSGKVPTTIEAMAKTAIDLIAALGIERADLFGFSTGSLVAQEVAIQNPGLVRRLIVVGSAPRGGVGMTSLTPEFQAMLAKPRAVPDELLLDVFFTPSAPSQAAGREFLTRLRARTVDRDIDPDASVGPAQATSLAAWGAARPNQYAYLDAITQPVLIVDGSKDLVFYTVNDFDLQQHLADAQLIIYPDSAHGPQYQYPQRFLQDAGAFLDRPDR
ncbi:MAG: alpha/beta fold hydrolase [Janthinobacterium lividum]